MTLSALLSWIVFVPTLGAVAVLFMSRAETMKRTALAATALSFLLSLGLIGPFLNGGASNPGGGYGAMQFVEKFVWIATSDGAFTIHYHLGVDGLSMPLVVLTTFITLLACLASWN